MLTIALAGEGGGAGEGSAIAASPAVDHLLLARSGDPESLRRFR